GNPAGYNDVIGNQGKEIGIRLGMVILWQLVLREMQLGKCKPDKQASTSSTQTDSAPVYDTNGSAEVHENCDDNEIFNMFTQDERYTELLEPIPESHQVLRNDNDVISEDTSVEQGGETNLAIEVEKVNSVNRS
nr:hypothetical protein [Tanacetum cinerariifolium]